MNPFDLVDDLVLDRVLQHLSASAVVVSCTPVSRRWLRVARRCRHVALHTLAAQSMPRESDTAALADLWLASGRLAFLCRALLRVEFVDELDAHLDAGMLVTRSADHVAIARGLDTLGAMILALAQPHSDASVLDDSALRAVLFFVRPQFQLLTATAVGIVANLAVLPRGRALLLRAAAHEALLRLIEAPISPGADSLLELALTAFSNLLTLPACRDAVLRDLPRVAGALRAIVQCRSGAAPDASVSFATQYQLRRCLRELVGKVDAALINAQLDRIDATQLLADAVSGAAQMVCNTRICLQIVGQTLALLMELGRPSVRPTLARSLLLKIVPALAFATDWEARCEELLHPLSVCLAQAVVSRDFGAALGSAGRGVLGAFVSRLLKQESRWHTSMVRLVTVCVQLTRQFGDCDVSSDGLRAADHDRRIEILLQAMQLAQGKIEIAAAKAYLQGRCDAATKKRVELGMTRLSLSQFVQQRDTWIETDDVFCIEPALHFDAVAFDSLESTMRLYDWLRVLSATPYEYDAIAAYHSVLFKVAQQLPHKHTTLFELEALSRELVALGRLVPLLAYALSAPGLIAAVKQALLHNVLDKSAKKR